MTTSTDTPRHCSHCGAAFERRVAQLGRKVWYFCPNCDAHGTGCVDRDHPPGKCMFGPGVD
jgi:hypothetical protein